MICSYSARFGITIYFVSDIIGSHMLAQYSDKKIGGSGMTVEIDESLFGKPKGIYSLLSTLLIFRFNCQANASTTRERLMAIVGPGFSAVCVGKEDFCPCDNNLLCLVFCI